MNIREFAEKIRAALSAALDREVQLKESLKLNGICRYGIIIVESESSLSPVIYLEPIFEDFQKKDSLEAALGTVISIYQRDRLKEPVSMEWITHFDQARETIFYYLINHDANQELLARMPHFRYLDLAIVFGMRSGLENVPGIIPVYNTHLDIWDTTAEELLSIAEVNTPQLFPLQLSYMPDLVPGEPPTGNPSQMYVLSNSHHAYGAAAFRYRDALKGFSLLMGSDILLLPDSIHQMVLVPLREGVDPESYRDTVRSTNDHFNNASKFLSNSIYLYKRDTGQVEII